MASTPSRGDARGTAAVSRAHRPLTSSSSAAPSSAPAPRGICARTASPAASSSSSAIRLRTRVGVSRDGRHPPAVLHAGHRADGAVQRRPVEGVRSAVCDAPAHTPRAWFRQRGYLFLADRAPASRADAALRARTARRRARPAPVARRDSRDSCRICCSTTSSSACSGPRMATRRRARCCCGFRHAAARRWRRVPRMTKWSASSMSRRRVTGVRLASGAHDRHARRRERRRAVGWTRGRAGRSATCRSSRCGRCCFARRCRARWPHRFPMVIDPGRRALASRRSGRRRRTPIASSSRSRSGTSRSAKTSRRTIERWDARVPAGAGPAPAGVQRRSRDVEGWAGLYEMTPDHNPVLGEHPALRGFIFANGFSGHGLMMSPATGKIVSETRAHGTQRRRSTSRSSPPTASSAARWCTTRRRSRTRGSRRAARCAIVGGRLRSRGFGARASIADSLARIAGCPAAGTGSRFASPR